MYHWLSTGCYLVISDLWFPTYPRVLRTDHSKEIFMLIPRLQAQDILSLVYGHFLRHSIGQLMRSLPCLL